MSGMTKRESEIFLKVLEVCKTRNFELAIKPLKNTGWRIVVSTNEKSWHIGEGLLFPILKEIVDHSEFIE